MVAGAALALALAGCNATEERTGARGTVGYAVTPPAGWEDITRAVEERTGAGFDVAYGGPTTDGVQANVNVARRDACGAGLAELVREGRDEVRKLGGGDLEFTRAVPASVDGERALRYDFTTKGTTVRQVGVMHAGGYHVVTLTAPRRAFRRSAAALDGMLRSWRWDP